MCGRFNITSDPLTRLLLEITGQEFVLADRYYFAPTQDVPVLLRTAAGEWELKDMRWWLVPYWSPEPSTRYSMFNAKSESLSKSRAFKESFKSRRCIVPASGYFEWIKQGDRKLPMYITPESADGLAFAALWDRWQRDERVIESCTIITAAAPASIKHIHHRIPVHLTPAEVQAWVNAETSADQLQQLLAPRLPGPLVITPVSTAANNARNKDEGIIEPLGDSERVH